MGRKLAEYVHINGQVFAPGDEPPADVAEQITNPAVWEGAGEEEPQVQQDRSSASAEAAQQDEQQARRSRGNK